MNNKGMGKADLRMNEEQVKKSGITERREEDDLRKGDAAVLCERGEQMALVEHDVARPMDECETHMASGEEMDVQVDLF